MKAAAIELEGLKVHFGGVRAVDGISLSLAPGSLLGLVGPNGSGKTTMINAISGLAPITAGTIRLEGDDVTTASPHLRVRRGMARTFQLIRLLDELSVEDNVALGADWALAQTGGRSRRDRAARRRRAAVAADAAIARLDLGDHVHARPQSLSYGTQRRVEIARALAGEPRVLLLDEPVAGMNREERDQIAAVISSLRTDGLSQILIEHDLRMIIDLCDEMLVLNFGREIAAGKPRETAADPAVRVAYLGDRHVAA